MFAKLMLIRLLALVVRDSVITLSAIAYNVTNNLGEVLLAIQREHNYQKPFSSDSRFQ